MDHQAEVMNISSLKKQE